MNYRSTAGYVRAAVRTGDHREQREKESREEGREREKGQRQGVKRERVERKRHCAEIAGTGRLQSGYDPQRTSDMGHTQTSLSPLRE